ncbi:Glycosyltransferase involved in cell wall bisynthesis [Pseudobutyrivibrio sp. 49]|uniref:glycosyltransferase family 2 protein n=1 Tax=unclassified Pseudobutyrivibrio TaxID=2638619 RepID=UPI0008871F72|nr:MULTISPECIES: glycosyltransferase family A protein [unclassified Pseudobutyrivibrio]SDH96000.1 Glycosyltransferase involved in cell wall bisynthesis [Pseudobutyrivibrio sp. 49]SFN86366.1 Glycosyltransferase involved in cell wall bisynthesis [Pseudobutyrivibrio sp. UC1225]
MKLLSFAVPCYNSAAYMEHCVETLLHGGEDVEIIIVDDGSQKDNTGEIADRLQAEHPTIVKAVHQENGGHGQAVNTGLKNATGLFFKVVDSDDWVDLEAYDKVLKTLRLSVENGKNLDMLISNFVYDKEGASHKKVMSYSNLPKNKYFTWDDCGHFRKGQYILMHSVIYRTKLLRDCGMELPKHTFYVDNLYVYYPLPYVKNMYYLDVDFYRYYIGRDDQSVNEKVMISRIDQQIKVNKLMLEAYDYKNINNSHVKKYMFNYLEMITVISTVLLMKSGTKENQQKRHDLWRYIKSYDYYLYRKLRYGFMCATTNLPGHGGRAISITAYKIAQKVVGFN